MSPAPCCDQRFTTKLNVDHVTTITSSKSPVSIFGIDRPTAPSPVESYCAPNTERQHDAQNNQLNTD
ncbi:MAG: hypothetical protein R3E58_09990 [Phycisphaerae bacterium]